MRQFSESIWASIKLWVVLLLVGGIYLDSMPRTVQAGDSGELVLAAFDKLVPHPPGYPLWVWLNHFWLKLFSGVDIYFYVAILCSLLGLGTYIFLYNSVKEKTWGLFAVASIACGPFFWKYFIVPEVFSLHIFLCAAILLCAFSSVQKGDSFKNQFFIFLTPILYGLGVANHLTIIALLPVMLWLLWEHRKNPIYYLGAVVGVFLFIALYFSLLRLNTRDLYSWGHLQNASDVVGHFFRKDYGTWSLTSITHPQHREGRALIFLNLLNVTLIQTAPLLIVLATLLYKKIKTKFSIAWDICNSVIVICIAISLLIFFLMGQLAPIGFFSDVLPRFYLMPIFLVTLLLVRLLDQNIRLLDSMRDFIFILSLGVVGINFFVHRSHNDLSENTIIEDFSRNVLKTIHGYKQPLVFLDGDTELFATRYVQRVQGLGLNVPILTEGQVTYRWMYEKVRNLYPEFKVDIDKLEKLVLSNPYEDFIFPNADKFSFFSTWDIYRPNKAKITYLPSIKLVENGTGIFIDSRVVPEFRSDLSIINSSWYSYDPYRAIFAKYAYFFLAEARLFYSQGKVDQVESSLNKALLLVPYCTPALQSLCNLKGEHDSSCETLEKMRNFYPYFQDIIITL